MPVTECEPETTRKSSRKSAKTQETACLPCCADGGSGAMPLDSLIKSPLKLRTVPYSAESVSELADSIKGVGLLQNLVVHALPVTVTVSPQVVADWRHSTCWQSVTSFRLTGLSA